MAETPILSLEALSKHYPVTRGFLFAKTVAWVRAVQEVELQLARGETLALVGESGCGKTTTAKLILRLESPTQGRVLLDGQDVHALQGDSLRNYRMRVQAVFQDPWSSLNPRMRVRDIVAEPLIVNRAMPRKAVAERVAVTLEEVGLRPEHAANFPHEFSGGQRQRISIASALISEPSLLILDEPVSALDVSIRSQIMNLFKDLQVRHGMSYLLVAHDLGTTRFMSDSVAVMYLGRIVEYAETESLYESPQHPYTKALFSAALPSHPDIQREEIVLEGEVPSPINPPGGCAFHPRCPMKIGAICEQEIPMLKAVAAKDRHQVACHLYDSQTP